MRELVIGDIHGCNDALGRLLELVAPLPGDRLIFLGDYVDRGPDSRGVIERLIALEESGRYETIFLKGNHEAMLLDYLETGNLLWLINGGDATLRSYGCDRTLSLPVAHCDFLGRLRLWYETDTHIFVHAGLRPGLPLQEQREEDILWIRGDFLDTPGGWGKTVVYGHTPTPEPRFGHGHIGIDTGAVYRHPGRSGYLTCLETGSGELWSVAGC